MSLTITIDGRPVETASGQTILQTARKAGVVIPSLCQVEGFEPSASCFLCAVKIEGRANLWPSCATPVADGMAVITQSEEVRTARRSSLELLLSDHAGDCIGPCRTGCPAGLDIPNFISRIAAGDPAKAADIVTNGLTLPASLGRICPRLCEQRCRQCDVTEALSIRNLHRFVADAARDRAPSQPRPDATPAPPSERVAIVGAGPAGLAAAYHLLQCGHGVVVFDAHEQPGGMLRYGIPAFRLPRQVLDAEVRLIRSLGAEFRLGKRLGHDFSLDDLRRDFGAVFLGIGAQGSRGLGCVGEDLATPALEFLANLAAGAAPTVGSDVIVVGGGNTAMDASRCAVRLGAKSVRVFYRRTRREMPCLMEEVEAAEAEGVKVEFLVAPVRLDRKGEKLRLICQRMMLGALDESNRARSLPVPGTEFEVEATCVIAAIGQSVEAADLSAPQLTLSKWGIAADPKTLATNLPGVFAGGDAITGPDLAVRAVAAGKLAAASIDQYLTGKPVVGIPQLVNVMMGKLSEEELAAFLRGVEQAPRTPMPHLPMDKRRTTFEEVELGFSPEAAIRESRRCLGCGCGKAISCRLRQLATEYGVDPQRFVGERRRFARDTSHPDIIYEPGKCIICGACVKVAEQGGEELGVSFVGRGFQVAVAAPFDRPMAEALRQSARRAAEVCPTGAIMLRGNGCAGCRFA